MDCKGSAFAGGRGGNAPSLSLHRRCAHVLKLPRRDRISRGARRVRMNDTVLEQHSFGAEVGRLLDLVVHSLYSEREIFLRKLVANAADAVDRRRFEALTDANLAPPTDAKIRIVPDKQASTLLISDDGIGMSRQEMIDNLGTIARSGTRAFAETLASAKPEDRPSLIGQFGVGFYS